LNPRGQDLQTPPSVVQLKKKKERKNDVIKSVFFFFFRTKKGARSEIVYRVFRCPAQEEEEKGEE
jgi:hypothetical protein